MSKAVVMHPGYNTRALKHRGVSEFYDYDVALIQVDKGIPLSWRARSESWMMALQLAVWANRTLKG